MSIRSFSNVAKVWTSVMIQVTVITDNATISLEGSTAVVTEVCVGKLNELAYIKQVLSVIRLLGNLI